MEVKSKNDGLITNIEVLEVIKGYRSSSTRNASKVSLQDREAVEIKAVKYIEYSKIASLTTETIGQCIEEIKQLNFGLTEAEILQIVNLAPASDVEFYLIIESCSDRLDEEQVQTLKDVVTKFIPQPNDDS